MTQPLNPPPVKVSAVVGLLVFVEITSGLIQGMMLPITPAIGKAYGVSNASLHWVSAVQLLSAAICVPVFARLGDMYGHRRLLRISLLFLLAGSALVAWAPSFELLLVGRALMGPMAGLLPLEFGIVRSRLEPERARSAIGMLVGSLTLGTSLGLIVGGVVHTVLKDIHLTLTVPLVMTALCVVVVAFWVPESTERAVASIDWAGAAALSLGLVTLLLGLSGASVPLLGAAAALLALWVWIELRAEHPLVDVRNLVRPRLVGLYVASFMLGFSMFGAQTASATFMASVPEKVGYGFGFAALSLALMMIPSGLFAMLGASTMAGIGTRIGHGATLLLGLGLTAAGYLLVTVLHASPAQFLAATALISLGTGVALASIPALIAERAPITDIAISTGMYNTFKTLGGSVSGAVFAGVLSTMVVPGGSSPAESGYVTVWVICAAASVLAVLFLLAVARRTPAAGSVPSPVKESPVVR
ncbi:MFS transporter [Planomonospora venezuelensis]|uniref:MFS family permease n=1 Tax=Planomonospora venezuelensis TaxID=1999 RepID=A0A841DCL4_PLAVE|nr:MFS transporter [Planomonospora venezuelensis]MBB5967800.1 MFS family permease [Planomonospora venezuelensis]GIN03222.1 MFS transporter [Planomonospora venezuelensis]